MIIEENEIQTEGKSPIRLRSLDDIDLFEKLHEGVENGAIAVIGSYLCKSDTWHSDESDIDVVTFDILTGFKVRQNAIRYGIRAQVVFLTESDFHSIECKTTLHNFGFSLSKDKDGKNIIRSSAEAYNLYLSGTTTLCPNNKSLTIFRGSNIVFKHIMKYLGRDGFTDLGSYEGVMIRSTSTMEGE